MPRERLLFKRDLQLCAQPLTALPHIRSSRCYCPHFLFVSFARLRTTIGNNHSQKGRRSQTSLIQSTLPIRPPPLEHLMQVHALRLRLTGNTHPWLERRTLRPYASPPQTAILAPCLILCPIINRPSLAMNRSEEQKLRIRVACDLRDHGFKGMELPYEN